MRQQAWVKVVSEGIHKKSCMLVFKEKSSIFQLQKNVKQVRNTWTKVWGKAQPCWVFFHNSFSFALTKKKIKFHISNGASCYVHPSNETQQREKKQADSSKVSKYNPMTKQLTKWESTRLFAFECLRMLF